MFVITSNIPSRQIEACEHFLNRIGYTNDNGMWHDGGTPVLVIVAEAEESAKVAAKHVTMNHDGRVDALVIKMLSKETGILRHYKDISL